MVCIILDNIVHKFADGIYLQRLSKFNTPSQSEVNKYLVEYILGQLTNMFKASKRFFFYFALSVGILFLLPQPEIYISQVQVYQLNNTALLEFHLGMN